MNNLDDIRDYLQTNLTRVLAIALVAVSGIGVTVFGITNVLPAWKAHNELAAQVVSAQDSLQAQQDAGLSSSDSLRTQAVTMRTKVAQQATIFLTEKEAAQVLANLYGYAKDAGAQVINLQAQPAPKSSSKTPATTVAPVPYTTRVFRVTVSGDADALVSFLARFREAALPGVTLNNMKTTPNGSSATLVVDLTMYTSPYAPGNVLAAATGSDVTPLPLPELETAMASSATQTRPTGQPTLAPTTGPVQTGTPVAAGPTPTSGPTSSAPTTAPGAATQTPGTAPAATEPGVTTPAVAVQSLLDQLDTEWAAQNWPAIITISQQILAIDPTTPGLSVKLYSAHTNYGYQLAAQSKTEQARAEFTAALSINPDGAAAQAGLKMLSNPSTTPVPAVKIYVVQWGDTLANIAIHFNVSVQAIKATNHLTDDRIYAGQELLIPG